MTNKLSLSDKHYDLITRNLGLTRAEAEAINSVDNIEFKFELEVNSSGVNSSCYGNVRPVQIISVVRGSYAEIENNITYEVMGLVNALKLTKSS